MDKEIYDDLEELPAAPDRHFGGRPSATGAGGAGDRHRAR